MSICSDDFSSGSVGPSLVPKADLILPEAASLFPELSNDEMGRRGLCLHEIVHEDGKLHVYLADALLPCIYTTTVSSLDERPSAWRTFELQGISDSCFLLRKVSEQWIWVSQGSIYTFCIPKEDMGPIKTSERMKVPSDIVNIVFNKDSSSMAVVSSSRVVIIDTKEFSSVEFRQETGISSFAVWSRDGHTLLFSSSNRIMAYDTSTSDCSTMAVDFEGTSAVAFGDSFLIALMFSDTIKFARVEMENESLRMFDGLQISLGAVSMKSSFPFQLASLWDDAGVALVVKDCDEQEFIVYHMKKEGSDMRMKRIGKCFAANGNAEDHSFEYIRFHSVDVFLLSFFVMDIVSLEKQRDGSIEMVSINCVLNADDLEVASPLQMHSFSVFDERLCFISYTSTSLRIAEIVGLGQDMEEPFDMTREFSTTLKDVLSPDDDISIVPELKSPDETVNLHLSDTAVDQSELTCSQTEEQISTFKESNLSQKTKDALSTCQSQISQLKERSEKLSSDLQQWISQIPSVKEGTSFLQLYNKLHSKISLLSTVHPSKQRNPHIRYMESKISTLEAQFDAYVGEIESFLERDEENFDPNEFESTTMKIAKRHNLFLSSMLSDVQRISTRVQENYQQKKTQALVPSALFDWKDMHERLAEVARESENERISIKSVLAKFKNSSDALDVSHTAIDEIQNTTGNLLKNSQQSKPERILSGFASFNLSPTSGAPLSIESTSVSLSEKRDVLGPLTLGADLKPSESFSISSFPSISPITAKSNLTFPSFSSDSKSSNESTVSLKPSISSFNGSEVNKEKESSDKTKEEKVESVASNDVQKETNIAFDSSSAIIKPKEEHTQIEPHDVLPKVDETVEQPTVPVKSIWPTMKTSLWPTTEQSQTPKAEAKQSTFPSNEIKSPVASSLDLFQKPSGTLFETSSVSGGLHRSMGGFGSFTSENPLKPAEVKSPSGTSFSTGSFTAPKAFSTEPLSDEQMREQLSKFWGSPTNSQGSFSSPVQWGNQSKIGLDVFGKANSAPNPMAPSSTSENALAMRAEDDDVI